MSGARRCTVAIALVLFSAPLFAQASAPVGDTGTQRQWSLGAQAGPSAVAGNRVVAAAVTARRDTLTGSRVRRPWSYDEGAHTVGTVMMIAGGVAVLAGTVISGKTGTTIAITGGVLALAGLWIYAK